MKVLLDTVVALTTGLLFAMATVGGVTVAVCGISAGGCLWWRRARKRSRERR